MKTSSTDAPSSDVSAGHSTHVDSPADPAKQKRRGLTWVALAYVTALAAAWATLAGVPLENLLYRTLAADVVATCVIFGWSLAFDNSSFYDPYWSLAPIAVLIYWMSMLEAGEPTLRAWAVLIVIVGWGMRLTFNWASGWTGLDHEDWRYVDFREASPRFYWAISLSGIHFFPTAIVFAGLAAVYPAFIGLARAPSWLDGVALGIGLLGIWFEWQADRQLRTFVQSERESGAILRTGLWRYSRHPNYLGEMLIWWSLFLFGLSADPAWAAWAVLAPVSMTAMFLFASIPMLEKRSLTRRPGYQRVIDETSMLIPMPPRVAAVDVTRS